MPAGESSVRVVVGEPVAGPGPSSRGGGLRRVSRASLEGVSTRSRCAAAQRESCGLMRVTMGSRAAHVTAKAMSGGLAFRRCARRVSPGTARGMCARFRQRIAQARLRSLVSKGYWYKPMVKSGGAQREADAVVVLQIVLIKMVGGKAPDFSYTDRGGKSARASPGMPAQPPWRAI
jgi:hypothetical protein